MSWFPYLAPLGTTSCGISSIKLASSSETLVLLNDETINEGRHTPPREFIALQAFNELVPLFAGGMDNWYLADQLV